MGLRVEDQEDLFFIGGVGVVVVPVRGGGLAAAGGAVFGVAASEGFGGVGSRALMAGMGVAGRGGWRAGVAVDGDFGE